MIKTIKKLIGWAFHNQFIRFLFVGGLNALFGYGIFALFIYFKFHYTVASLLATILGILFNFQTVGRLVFKSKNKWLIFKFFGVYAVVYLLNIAGLKVFNNFNISNYIGGAVLIVPMAIVSYFLNKKFVFIEKK